MHEYALVCIGIYGYALVSYGIHEYALVYTGIFWYFSINEVKIKISTRFKLKIFGMQVGAMSSYWAPLLLVSTCPNTGLSIDICIYCI